MKTFRKILWIFSKEGIEYNKTKMMQENCKHEHWNCDNQIRVIECKKCKLRAWIDDYVDLYKK